MKPVILFLSLCTLTALQASDGEKLYTEAKCQSCHLLGANFDPNSINKPGKASKVNDPKSLLKWVVSCDNYFSTGWFPEEQREVADYLNRVYYKFRQER
jgi:hypothetical protein